MRNKSGYIILYTVILCIVSAVSLASLKQVLGKKQDKNVSLDNKKKILKTVMNIDTKTPNQINQIYDDLVSEFVIDYNGKKLEGVLGSSIKVQKERKEKPENRKLPLYSIKDQNDKTRIAYYVFPTSGRGLWDAISSYICIGADGKTIKGIAFDHVGETPGLGARIKADPTISVRYNDKKLYDETFKPVAVKMMKGEGNNYEKDPHKVDGMSGATITANGVNDMLKDYAYSYQIFFKSLNNQ